MADAGAIDEPRYEVLVPGALYQLSPAPASPAADIVFFHGLQLGDFRDAYKTTWKTPDNGGMHAFLASDFPSARIISVSYNAGAFAGDDIASIDNLAGLIHQSLIQANIGQGRSVVFVGHSLGGIVMKKVFSKVSNACRDRSDRVKIPNESLYNNMEGMVWYGTPHSGATLADKAKILSVFTSEVTKLLVCYSEKLAVINGEFLQALPAKVKLLSFYETKKTRMGWWGLSGAFEVVPHMATHGVGVHPEPLNYNHIDLCKPTHKAMDPRYVPLRSFIAAEIGITQRPVEVCHLFDEGDPIPGHAELLMRPELQYESSAPARFLIIHGEGGMGKTTLANALYNKLTVHFPGRSAARVEATADMTNAAIRSAWLKEIKLWQENSTPDEHKTKLDKWLDSAPAKLVVLDNIWKQKQLESLFTHSVTAGSLVIITSRRTDVRIGLSPHRAQLFPMPGLNPDDATAMFRHCADTLVPPYPALETKIITACAGMPLALEVAASRLRVERELKDWEATVALLETGHMVGEKLQEMIDQSVADLRRDGDLAYNMFLDAATVMHGHSQQHAVQVWLAMYSKEERVVRLSWAALTQRSLVKADDEGKLRVHDVTKALAGRKAEDDGTRVWQPHQVPNTKARAIVAHDWRQFGPMPDLQVMLLEKLGYSSSIRDVLLHIRFFGALPAGLLWLRLPRWCRSLDALEQATLSKLRVLDCTGCLALQSVPESLGNLTGLTSLGFSWCLALLRLPESIGQLTGLTSLDFKGCKALQSVPESIGQLTGLTSLSFDGCMELQSVPESIGHLNGLRSLDFTWCNNLQSVPESIGQLTRLTSLCFLECRALKSVPESIGQLTGLASLTFSGCIKLQSVPESIGQLTGLTSLHFHGCEALQSVPESIGKLTGLTSLNFYRCQALQSVPESIGELTGLTSLSFDGCMELQSVPESIGQLTGLTSLSFDGCMELQSVPESIGHLNGLRSLILDGCQDGVVQAAVDALTLKSPRTLVKESDVPVMLSLSELAGCAAIAVFLSKEKRALVPL